MAISGRTLFFSACFGMSLSYSTDGSTMSVVTVYGVHACSWCDLLTFHYSLLSVVSQNVSFQNVFMLVSECYELNTWLAQRSKHSVWLLKYKLLSPCTILKWCYFGLRTPPASTCWMETSAATFSLEKQQYLVDTTRGSQVAGWWPAGGRGCCGKILLLFFITRKGSRGNFIICAALPLLSASMPSFSLTGSCKCTILSSRHMQKSSSGKTLVRR